MECVHSGLITMYRYENGMLRILFTYRIFLIERISFMHFLLRENIDKINNTNINVPFIMITIIITIIIFPITDSRKFYIKYFLLISLFIVIFINYFFNLWAIYVNSVLRSSNLCNIGYSAIHLTYYADSYFN